MDKIIEKLVKALEQRIGNEISTSQLIKAAKKKARK